MLDFLISMVYRIEVVTVRRVVKLYGQRRFPFESVNNELNKALIIITKIKRVKLSVPSSCGIS